MTDKGTDWGSVMFWFMVFVLAILTLGEPDLLDAIVVWVRTWSHACP